MTADQVTNYMKGNEIHVQMSRFNYFTIGPCTLHQELFRWQKHIAIVFFTIHSIIVLPKEMQH